MGVLAMLCLALTFGGCYRLVRNDPDFQNLETRVDRMETHMLSQIESIRRDMRGGYRTAPSGPVVPMSNSPTAYTPGTTTTLEPTEQIPAGDLLSDIQVKGLYDNALDAYKRGEYERAAPMFGQIAAQAPNHPLAPNALYWFGECYYSRAYFQEAVAAFDRILRRYPQSGKAPDALIKIAYSYNNLKDGEAAMRAMRDLLAKYPASPAAQMVRTGKTIFRQP